MTFESSFSFLYILLLYSRPGNSVEIRAVFWPPLSRRFNGSIVKYDVCCCFPIYKHPSTPSDPVLSQMDARLFWQPSCTGPPVLLFHSSQGLFRTFCFLTPHVGMPQMCSAISSLKEKGRDVSLSPHPHLPHAPHFSLLPSILSLFKITALKPTHCAPLCSSIMLGFLVLFSFPFPRSHPFPSLIHRQLFSQ